MALAAHFFYILELAGYLSIYQRRVHHPRQDGVDSNAILGILHSHCARELIQSRFGR